MEDPIEALTRSLLVEVGENPEREGLLKTPGRVARAMRFFTKGYQEDVESIINGAIFEGEDYDEMVLVRDIEFYSLCEHHMVPFFGQCHIAYIPDRKIIGLSKVARLVDVFARRLQVQERLTTQIAQVLERHLKPKGVAVVMEGEHLCMMMRGVEKQHSMTTTSAMLGVFREDRGTRMEFLELIRSSGSR
jgi:GTP cyclohydrolase I